jgi:hypothetical protein
MAIDTANKRASSLLDDCGILFPPDGTISAFDRGWLVGQYAGIAGAPPVVRSPDATFTMPRRGLVFTVPSRGSVFRIPGPSGR